MDLLFNYSEEKEYDDILATEVYPAIVKAFGVLQSKKDSALLFAAAEHLNQSVSELTTMLRDTYVCQPVNKHSLEKYRGNFRMREEWKKDYLREADECSEQA